MMNGVILQSFQWYSDGNGGFWNKIKENAESIAAAGISALWLPPAFKGATGAASVGYDIYDLYDLGEFDQKGGIRTKYGTKEEYLQAIEALQKAHIGIYADIVLNHKMGADEKEKVALIEVDPRQRTATIGEPFEGTVYTVFTFPGRNGKYSGFKWDYQCFTGVDHVEEPVHDGIFKIRNQYGDTWADDVDSENGNFDYLMGADIEFRNPHVVEELNHWIAWYYDLIQFNGLRLDAVKHIPASFYREWARYVSTAINPDCFFVGEYWSPHLDALTTYLQNTDYQINLFDVPLQHNFHVAGDSGNSYDLSKIFDGSLVQAQPDNAVTLVTNHDTQPLQALEAPVAPWFKPLAYALILLRKGGYPCIFSPDLLGAGYTDKGEDGQEHEIILPPIEVLPQLLQIRKQFAYGEQTDFLDHPNCIAWIRHGEEDMHNGCIAVLSNSEAGRKEISLGASYAHARFYDYLGYEQEAIVLNEEGSGTFTCPAGSLSVWVLIRK